MTVGRGVADDDARAPDVAACSGALCVAPGVWLASAGCMRALERAEREVILVFRNESRNVSLL